MQKADMTSVVAQSEERWAHKSLLFGHPEVTGSRPVDASIFCLFFLFLPAGDILSASVFALPLADQSLCFYLLT